LQQDIYLATMDGNILKSSADGSRLLFECTILAGMSHTLIEDIAVEAGGTLCKEKTGSRRENGSAIFPASSL